MKERDSLYNRLLLAIGFLAGRDMPDSALAIFELMQQVYGQAALQEVEAYRQLVMRMRDDQKSERPA